MNTQDNAAAMLERLVTQWDAFLAQNTRVYRRLGALMPPPHGGTVFNTAPIRWDPIELAAWLYLVPQGWARILRRDGARVRNADGVWLGHLPITLEAADGPFIDATDHVRFELRLLWRHDPTGWALVGVSPDRAETERERRTSALIAETDPFLAAMRGHIDREAGLGADHVIAEVKDSARTTRPELLAVLLTDDPVDDPQSGHH